MYAISDTISHTPPTVIQATTGLSTIVNVFVCTCSARYRWFYRRRPRRGVGATLSAGVRRSDFFSILTEVLKGVLLMHLLRVLLVMFGFCVYTGQAFDLPFELNNIDWNTRYTGNHSSNSRPPNIRLSKLKPLKRSEGLFLVLFRS